MKDCFEIICSAFECAFLDGRYKKWLVHADKHLKFYFKGECARHYKAADVITDIMLKTIEGKRNWDISKVKIDAYMYHQIKSAVWNLSRREFKVSGIHECIEDEESGEYNQRVDQLNSISLDEILNEMDNKELLEICYKEIENDTEAGLVFLEMGEGKTNIEISQSLGIEVREIVNIKKRLKRKLNKIISFS